MAETLTVDTSPQTEVLTQDEQESLEIGEQLQAEQESLLAGKYKDAQQLEKAYIELQKKLGSSEDSSEPQAEKSEELEIEKEEPEAEKEADTNFLDRLWDEAQSEYKDETMKELSEMSSRDLAQMHLQYRANNQQQQQEPLSDKQVAGLKGVAGGEKSYNNMLGWAKDNLADKEISMYDAVIETERVMVVEEIVDVEEILAEMIEEAQVDLMIEEEMIEEDQVMVETREEVEIIIVGEIIVVEIEEVMVIETIEAEMIEEVMYLYPEEHALRRVRWALWPHLDMKRYLL